MAIGHGEQQQPANIPDVDPYIDWVLGIGRSSYFLPGRQEENHERMPLLLRLHGISAEEFVNGGAEGAFFIDDADRRRRWKNSFQILSLQSESLTKTSASVLSMATNEIREDILSPEGAGQFVKSVMLGRPLDTQSLPPLMPDSSATLPAQIEVPLSASTPLAPTPPPDVVVMGIIDDGIAFAHERFRAVDATSVKTRVEYWWLQDGTFPTLLNKAQIDNLLTNCSLAGRIDEDLLYRVAGLTDYTQEGHKSAAGRIAHGTHVMDAACGYDPAHKRYDRPIVCVQLPTRVTADTSGGSLFPWAAYAIWFIVSCAVEIAKTRTVKGIVINLSYGFFAGPHDGTLDIEEWIEDRIAEYQALGLPPVRVVLPAGNSFLSRTHARFAFPAVGNVKSLPWCVLPDDQTPSFVEIWLPGVAPATVAGSRITLTVRAPGGTAFSMTEQAAKVDFGGPGHKFGQMMYQKSTSSLRGHFVIMLNPTADPNGTINTASETTAAAGTWTIELKCTKAFAPGEKVHAWVQRDDSLYGFPLRGRQSYFDDPLYERFDHAGHDLEIDNVPNALVLRQNTLNAIATEMSRKVIVMGGYLRKERAYAKYSSANGLAEPPRQPDAMMVSEDSRVHTGILAAGSRSGSVVPMGGTSVAAPQIARKIAHDLAAGGNGDRKFVRDLADFDDPPYPNAEAYRGGHGRIISPRIVPLKRYDP